MEAPELATRAGVDNSGAAAKAILPPGDPRLNVPEGAVAFIRTLRFAARDPATARRVSAALQRAALYDDRPRDHLREHADARRPDHRIEPYLISLTRYAHELENPKT